MAEHYAYCKDFTCVGCLPSDEALETLPVSGLWVEMLRRCIPQQPSTKTKEGALAALIKDGTTYREASRQAREALL